MIKKKEEMPRGPIEIDLTGPEGNVFALMGYAKRLAKQIYGNENFEMKKDTELFDDLGIKDMNLPKNMGELIINKMMESDYEHAVQVFDKYFGEYVILYR
jgi:hypothetical protein